MAINQSVARNLDESVKIVGLTPLELACSAITYAILSPALKGVPFAALLSLTASLGMALGILILNRTYPPNHGLFWILQLFRPKVVSVMPLATLEDNS